MKKTFKSLLSTQYDYFIQIYYRKWSFFHDFLFFEDKIIDFNPSLRVQNFINKIDLFDIEDNYFQYKVSKYVESALRTRGLKNSRKNYLNRFYSIIYRVAYSYKPRFINFDSSSKRLFLVIDYTRIKKLRDLFRLTDKKILFLKLFYIPQDDFFQTRSLFSNTVNSKLKYRILNNNISFLVITFNKVKETLNSLTVITLLKEILLLKPFGLNFWSRYQNLASEWRFYSGATLTSRVLDQFNRVQKIEPIPIKKVKTTKSRFTKKKLLKSITYRLPIKNGTNRYVEIRNLTLKNRFRRYLFKKGPLFYNYKLKDHNFKRFKRREKIKNFSTRLNSLNRDPSFPKVFSHFLRTQNLSTSEQNDAFLRLSLRALHFKGLKRKILRRKPKTKVNLLNVNDFINKKNFEFSLNLTSLNYYKLPNLNSFRESKALFQMDSAFGQPFNLRLQSNPDFFWDEWDVSFLSQQNGLASTLQPYEDDYLGEDRFFSPATAIDHIEQSPHTKKDSTDLEIEYENYFQWRFNKDKFREPHRKSHFKGVRTKQWLPVLTGEPSVVYREEPDWENAPGIHGYDNNQEEIIVGDGPLNIPVMTSDRAGSLSRPEFRLKRSQTDPFDSTLLYDLYTLNRVASSFSERNIFNHFESEDLNLLTPYVFASSCEDYFFRQRYIKETDIDFAPGYDLTPLLAAGAWDIPYVIPHLSTYFVDNENMELTSKNFVLEGLGNSLDSQKTFKNWSKSFWRERISRSPIIRFYDSAFTNPNNRLEKIKHSRAFFYNDRALARKFSQGDNKSQVLSPYPVSVFSKTDFPNLLLSFLFASTLLILIFTPVFFYFFKYEWVSKLFYSSPFFEFWDVSGLPNFTKSKLHGVPAYSEYGSYIHEKLKVIQAYYKRYRYPDEYEYKMMIEKMKFDAAQKNSVSYGPSVIPVKLKPGELDLNRVTSPTYTNIPRVLELYDIAYEDDLFSALKSQTIPNLASLKILKTNINEYYPIKLNSYPTRDEFKVDQRFDGRRVLLNEILGIEKDTILGNFFYRKTDQTSLKRITSYSSVNAYRVLPLVGGHYNLTNQFLSNEHPYLNEAIRADFSSRTNRIFNFVRHSFFDRYHVEHRPYDIFKSDTRYGYSNTKFKPPATSILNTQTDIFRRTYGRVVPASVETPQLRIRFGQFDRPSNWEVTPEWFYHPQKLDGKMTFGEIFYRLWNRLFVFGPSESIGPRKDDYLTVGQIHFPFSHQRTPELFFYNDSLENTAPITRIPRKLDEETLQELKEFYFKSGTEEEELLNVIRDYRTPTYNYLFEEKLNKNSLLLKSKPYNIWGGNLNFKDQDSISSLGYTGGGFESFHARSYRMPLHSSRSRMTPYFNMYLNRRMTTTINTFGFDPFKVKNYFNEDNHPFKMGFPFLPIDKDFFSFKDLDSQRLRWFLSLDGSSNIGDSSVYNPAHGYRSYWFSKVGIDNTTRAYKSLLHVGSNYELRFMLTIPTFWETYYNSKWLSKIDDIFTTTNSDLMYKDDDLRDYSYTQGSYFLYSFYFIQDLLINRFKKFVQIFKSNPITIRNILFLIGLIYIFFPKYYYLRDKYYKNISNSVTLNRLSLISSATSNKTENLKQSDDIDNNYSKGYNKKFNISLFSRLKKKKSIYKSVLKSVIPEKLGSGSKHYFKRFLKRPKTLKNKLYLTALTKNNQSFINYKRLKKDSASINPRFEAIATAGYSFLWSTHNVDDLNSFNSRSKIYRNHILNKLKLTKTKKLNFVRRNLPYKLSKPSVIGYLNYDYNYSQYGLQTSKNGFSPQIRFDYEYNNIKLQALKDAGDNHVLRNFNYQIRLNSYLNKKTNFARRRLIWSYLRGLDRDNKKLFKKPTINQDYLLNYIKNENRLNFKKNISNLITLPEVFIKDNSTLFKAVNELNTFKIGDSIIIEKDEPTVIVDIDEDDEDEQIDSEEAREVEPVEQIALIADSEETEDYFDSLFLDLVFKLTPPKGTVELTLNSLLKVDSRVTISPTNYDNYYIYSELINYKRFRSSSDDYTYSIPAYEISLNDDIVQDLTFTPDYNFLVSYSMPRFLKRLTLKSELDFKYNTQITKFYDETDPEGFDIKPVNYYSLLNIKRDRLNELNLNDDIPFEFTSNVDEDYNLLFEKFSLNSDNSIISKINYTDNYRIDLNFNEESYFNSDYHIEEYDESAQLFESRQFYRWRYLSEEYLSLILNRESEFELTQLKPFKTRSDFTYDIFLKGEDFNFNQTFKKDLISDYIEDSVEINFELEDLIDYIIDEFDYDEDSISLFDEEIGDEDDDLKEDDEDFVVNEVKFIKEEDNILDFILREVDVAENSLQQQLLRFDPVLIAESDSIVFTNKYKRGVGFATRPTKNLFEQNQKDFWDDLIGDYRLNDKYYSDQNYDSSVSNDLVDLLIPLNQKQIIRITEDNDKIISADTVDRVILSLSSDTIERGKADLLLFRREIIKNNLNIPTIKELHSLEVKNKELLIYLILVQSPELNQCITRAKYSVIHEIQSSSNQSDEVEDLLSELNFLLSFDLFYDKRSFFNSDFKELSIFSSYYNLEKLNNDNIYYRIFQSDPSLKVFALNFLYFSRKGIA